MLSLLAYFPKKPQIKFKTAQQETLNVIVKLLIDRDILPCWHTNWMWAEPADVTMTK